MLTIQPDFKNYAQSKRLVAFKAQEMHISDAATSEVDEFYQSKVDYYKKQAKEFENLAKNSDSKGFKTTMKVFRVVSEALLEGWAVAWGASKGAKILKSSAISGSQSKFMSHVKNILKPIGEGIKGSKTKIGEYINKFKQTEFVTKNINRFNDIVGKMRNDALGKYIVIGCEYIGKAFKYTGKLAKAGFEYIAKPFRGKSASEIYDKAAQATSTTLGVGAGAAGAYNSATDNKGRVNTNQAEEFSSDPAEDIEGLDDEV